MARMIPAQIDSEGISMAERRVFGLLETDPATQDWTVLHSLGLARRVDGPYGEIDFVAIIPAEGIVCLEVKGRACVLPSRRLAHHGSTWKQYSAEEKPFSAGQGWHVRHAEIANPTLWRRHRRVTMPNRMRSGVPGRYLPSAYAGVRTRGCHRLRRSAKPDFQINHASSASAASGISTARRQPTPDGNGGQRNQTISATGFRNGGCEERFHRTHPKRSCCVLRKNSTPS